MVRKNDIILALRKMNYEDHDLLALQDVVNDPYESLPSVAGGTIVRIPKHWAHELDI